MKGCLYTITNTINGKQYVGKTYNKLDYRIKEHIRDSKRFPNRPLYRAINKYGFDNFKISVIDYFEQGLLEIEEQNLIEKLETYTSGYNATRGGDGSRYLKVTDNDIINCYEEYKNQRTVGQKLSIHPSTVSRILNKHNVKIITNGGLVNKLANQKCVKLVELDIIESSVDDLAKLLIATGISKTDIKNTCEGINRVLRGSRKTYLGFTYILHN